MASVLRLALLALLAALALVLYSPRAYAYGTVAPTAGGYSCTARLGTRTAGSPQAACAAAYNGPQSDVSGGYTTTTTYTVTGCVPHASFADWFVCTGEYRAVTRITATGELVSDDTYHGQLSATPASGACPDHATGDGSCSCDAGYKPDSLAKSCIPDCAANITASQGYFDIGTEQGATPLILGCAGQCEVIFDGSSPEGSSLVGGVKHWYAKGAYRQTGNACKPGNLAKQVGNGVGSTKPADSCGPNQGSATMNGKTVCVDQDGDGKTPTDDSTKKASDTTEVSKVTNPDGSVTTTETRTKIDANGNKEVSTTTTTSRPDGTSTTSTTVVNPGAAGGSSPNGSSDEGEETPCQKNPAGTGCGGEGATIGGLYVPKEKTMSGVLTAHRDAFMASPMGSAVGGFFVVSAAGSCPTFSGHIPYLDAEFTLDQFCSGFATGALLILKTCILVMASFMAFRIAVE